MSPPVSPQGSEPYRGPVVVLSRPEAQRVAQARAVLAKCSAAAVADPKWQGPLR